MIKYGAREKEILNGRVTVNLLTDWATVFTAPITVVFADS
jgi:hypothetical protein